MTPTANFFLVTVLPWLVGTSFLLAGTLYGLSALLHWARRAVDV